ncbi:ChaC-like protein-domain-containing protein [Halenospora varia]|nr:ChaC-like protein-domain-containing protein [Halenospora varia]
MAAHTGSEAQAPSSEFWLFGYGSLIWKPPPHFDRRVPGYVTGYVRRFWQASQDHRGTPEAPGRVVTLIERSFYETLNDHHPAGSERVWGTAYRIETERVAEVREYLDIREINGYTIHYTDFHPADGSPDIKTLVYIGTPDNDQFMGPQEPQQLAEHIFKSVGPSGPNKDYLLSLEVALDSLSPESGDGHIKDLANRVRQIESGSSAVISQEVVEHELHRVGSTEEQEEVEKGF